MTFREAKAALMNEGLTANEHGKYLWIAGTIHDSENGISYSNDACMLCPSGEGWFASLPSRGQFSYDIAGELSDLVKLIIEVYREHKRLGGYFWQAVPNVIPNLDQYRSDRKHVKEPFAVAR